MSRVFGKYQALLSWLLLSVAILFAVLVISGPLLDRHDKYRFELTKDGRLLQRLQALANSRGELEDASERFAQQGLSEWVYSPEMSASAVELAIQRRVSEVISSAEAEVRSIAPIDAKRRDGYTVVGVRAQFGGELGSVMSSLQMLEQGRPLLVLDELVITPSTVRRGRKGEGAQQALDVQISILAFLPLPPAEGTQ